MQSPHTQLVRIASMTLARIATTLRDRTDYEWTALCPHCFTPVRRRVTHCRICESTFEGSILVRTELPTVPLAS